MAKVKNLTGDTLGYGRGKQVGPGGEALVSDAEAALMVARNPQKFALVEEAAVEPERTVTEAPNRMQQGGRRRG